jgi:hypothetical protein
VATVTVDEIVRLVGSVLDGVVDRCAAGDADGSHDITVDEVVTAVTNGLFGCAATVSGPDLTRLFPRPKFGAGRGPAALATADLNDDGLVDITTANFGSGDLSVLLQKQTGGFETPRRVRVGDGPIDVLVTRLGAERRTSILAANYESSEVTVTRYDGSVIATTSLAVGESPIALAVADLNGDEWIDVITANTASGDVSVLLGEPDGTFGVRATFDAHGSPRSVSVGELDGDQIADVLVAVGTAQLSFLRGTGDGTTRPWN